MYFPKINKNKDEFEALICIIKLEYDVKNDEHLVQLLHQNFNLNIEALISSLKAYRVNMGENFTKESNKIKYGISKS